VQYVSYFSAISSATTYFSFVNIEGSEHFAYASTYQRKHRRNPTHNVMALSARLSDYNLDTGVLYKIHLTLGIAA
jgi:hypothetical protein